MVTCRCIISCRGTRGMNILSPLNTHTHTHTQIKQDKAQFTNNNNTCAFIIERLSCTSGSLLFTHMTHINPSPFFEMGSDIYPHFTDGILFPPRALQPRPSPHSWAACVPRVDSTSTLWGEGQSSSAVREDSCGVKSAGGPISPISAQESGSSWRGTRFPHLLLHAPLPTPSLLLQRPGCTAFYLYLEYSEF